VVTTADFLAKPANQASYQKYIKYVVKTYIDWQKSTLNWTQGTAATLPTITDFSAWLASNAEAGGDTTTGITVSTGTAQLIARGIYVDVLDPAYLVGIETSATDYLTKVPFQDINLTMLAEWTMGPLTLLTGSATDYATVTNEAVKTVVDLNNYYFGSYSRGYMTAKKSTKDTAQCYDPGRRLSGELGDHRLPDLPAGSVSGSDSGHVGQDRRGAADGTDYQSRWADRMPDSWHRWQESTTSGLQQEYLQQSEHQYAKLGCDLPYRQTAGEQPARSLFV
jgi:hypothetical protein